MAVSHNGRRIKHEDPVAMLNADIAAIKRDVGHLIGVGAGNVSGKAKQAMNKLTDEAKAMACDAKERLDSAHTQLSETTARRPLTTIAVSMAAGAVAFKLLGWALRR